MTDPYALHQNSPETYESIDLLRRRRRFWLSTIWISVAANTMGTELCLEALERAVSSTGRVPEIFNTDQGCQFTSAEWTGRLLDLGVQISMDGRGRWMDNVFIERLWRSVKYDEIYIKEHATLPALHATKRRRDNLTL